MTAILKVDTIQDTSGNNIINESSDTITIGASGDTIALAGTTVTGITQGITEMDMYRLTANITSDSDITSNLERVDTPADPHLGTGMSQSSGIFSFPSTGIYLIQAQGYFFANADLAYVGINVEVTTNNSSYDIASEVRNFIQQTSSSGAMSTGGCFHQLDVTDTTNIKVRFEVGVLNSSTETGGDSGYTRTSVQFIRLGDT